MVVGFIGGKTLKRYRGSLPNWGGTGLFPPFVFYLENLSIFPSLENPIKPEEVFVIPPMP
jgi:hypothetical protein